MSKLTTRRGDRAVKVWVGRVAPYGAVGAEKAASPRGPHVPLSRLPLLWNERLGMAGYLSSLIDSPTSVRDVPSLADFALSHQEETPGGHPECAYMYVNFIPLELSIYVN